MRFVKILDLHSKSNAVLIFDKNRVGYLTIGLLILFTIFGIKVSCAQQTGASSTDGSVLTINLNEARVINLPDEAKTLIIGNPSVADVTMVKDSHAVVITGKSYGSTNIIALDKRGVSIAESRLNVNTSSDFLVVQRGLQKESYFCNPRCEPTVSLGDDTSFMGNVAGQIQLRNNLNTSSTAAGAGSHSN